MDIQWYPGHMAKATRLMKESLPLIDIIIELLDARVPLSSINPEIDNLARNKKRIVILNKSDMSDSRRNTEWANYFNEKGHSVIMANSINGAGVNEVYGAAQHLMKEKMESLAKRGRISAPIRAMVVGIPNVGKSTFINKLVGKRSAMVGNKPGVTKAKQWLKVRNGFELLDTPGILWHKFEDQQVGVHLALTGAIKDELLEKGELCYRLIDILDQLYPDVLAKRYEIVTDGLERHEIINQIAEKRGHKLKGNELDLDRTYSMILDEFKKGKLGKLTIEIPQNALECCDSARQED